MKATELHEMSDEQLKLTLKDACENLFRLRIKAKTERLDAPSELRRHRRLIARIRTVQRERDVKAGERKQAEQPNAAAASAAANPNVEAK